MTIHPLLSSDVAQLAQLQPTGWPDILPTHEFYTRNDFCFPLKAVIDDRIAGIGTSIVHHDVGWLGHIIVHPDFRNRGVGQKITQALVDNTLSSKCPTLFLVATDMGEPVYKKVGFDVETRYAFFKDIPQQQWARSSNIVPYSTTFYDQIKSMDKLVSGEDRMFHLEMYINGGYIHLNKNEVDGFYLPSLGEGLIEATDEGAGLALMKFRLMTNNSAAFPVDNKVAMELMNALSMKEPRRASRMRLGIKREYLPQMIYNRIAGNIG